MNITVFTKSRTQENYLLPQDTQSKIETYEDISSKYTNDVIERIEITYDSIDSTTIDGKRTTETGSFVTVNTLDALKAELGKYTG